MTTTTPSPAEAPDVAAALDLTRGLGAEQQEHDQWATER
jgi:hypothetical protein